MSVIEFVDNNAVNKSIKMILFYLNKGFSFYIFFSFDIVRVLDHERNNEGSMLIYNLAVTKNFKMKMFTQDKSRKKQRSPVKTILIAFKLIQKESLNEH